ncbi:hypothetical protein GGR53DRAFT_271345 [Hypoxylon sp. FL1150]|nr:hypothetical protein GGR53DRAFT_271345 [Hypoxylon sp. FL1150]
MISTEPTSLEASYIFVSRVHNSFHHTLLNLDMLISSAVSLRTYLTDLHHFPVSFFYFSSTSRFPSLFLTLVNPLQLRIPIPRLPSSGKIDNLISLQLVNCHSFLFLFFFVTNILIPFLASFNLKLLSIYLTYISTLSMYLIPQLLCSL